MLVEQKYVCLYLEQKKSQINFVHVSLPIDRLCGLVVRVLGYRWFPALPEKKK
jgi:hypothetical protein